MKTIVLLIFSNLFMTTAWYGHLKFKSSALWLVIAVSWIIALPEYMLQVPANRFGHGQFSAPQLKIIQEVISITIFVGFCLLYLREPLKWNYVISFVCIVMAVVFAFWNIA
jgi:uncharacterized protein (DUF486 family)